MNQGTRHFGYVPALDGARALAVACVICFHAGFSGASGGFIGVSVFFTLSGFLITSLLIAEHDRTGLISLRAFYARRARRLLPAAYTCIALVLLALPFWSEAQRRRLPGDAFAALGNVANWRAAFATVSYRDLFASAPSPLAHFWSLAIEEQCYLVLPIIVIWALRRGRARLAATSLVLLAASFVAAILTRNFDLAYNGTHVRIAEVLVGVLLAVVLTQRSPDGAPDGLAARTIGVLGLLVLVGGTVVLGIGDEWLAHGGLVLVSLCSAALIIGALGNGPAARLLAWRPLVAIGKVSYGLYLYHWPLFLILTPERTGLRPWPLFGVRIAVLTVITVASFVLIERPIRQRRVFLRPMAATTALATAVAAVLVAVWVLPAPPLSATEQLLSVGQADLQAFSATPSTLPPPTVLVLGSNSAATTVLQAAGVQATIVDRVQPACPLLSGAEVQLVDGSRRPIDTCGPTASSWLASVADAHPDLVLVALGALDDGLVRAPAETTFPTADEQPAIQALLARARTEFTDLFAQLAGQSVPVLVYWPADPASKMFPLSEFLLGLRGVNGVVAAPTDLARRVEGELAKRSAPAAPRVLVLGDSTSLPFAAALDRAAAGSVDVRWAGHEGCPFVRDTEYRASTRSDQWFSEWFTPQHCGDFVQDLPPILASFRPDVVVIVADGTEVTQQRYRGDPTAYLPGSAGYRAYHDSEMDAFLGVVGPEGPPILVADSPPPGPGPWHDTGMGDPSRTTEWNAQITHWATSHPRLSVLSYGAPLVAYEAAHGSIRKDGLHPEVGGLTEVMRTSVLPEILQTLGPS